MQYPPIVNKYYLQLSFLNSFQATLNDQPLEHFRSDKVRALLVYMTLTDGPTFSRSALAGLLWPDLSESAARRNLRNTLFHLRQAIDKVAPDFSKQLFSSERNAVSVNPNAPIQSDVVLLEQRLAAIASHDHGNMASCDRCYEDLKQVALLYKGELLIDFMLDDAQPFMAWLFNKRQQLHRQAIEQLEWLTASHMQRGAWQEAQEIAQRQLELNSWHEVAYQQLMQVLVQLGDRAAALALYERCRDSLAAGLGVEPSKETRQLAAQIRESQVQIPGVPQHNLPALTTEFFGRKSELATLDNRLQSPGCRLVTLLGMGGIGKTHLALAVAHEQLAAKVHNATDSFWQAIYFVTLDPLRSLPSVAALAQAILNGLQGVVDWRGSQPEKERLASFFGDQTVLLIIDNFEYATAAASLLTHLLRSAPKLTILVTSRVPLQLRSEFLFDLPMLTLPAKASAHALDESEAAQLFLKRAQQHWHQFAPTEADHEAIVMLCQQTEGLPLALEMAASCIRYYTPQQISEQIGNSAEFLNHRLTDYPPRHQTVGAIFDSTWRLLNNREQQAFLTFTIFTGGFSRTAATAVAEISAAILDQLQIKSFLQWDRTHQRYHIHPLLLDFSMTILRQAPTQFQHASYAHARYFLNALQAQQPLLDEADMQQALLWFEQEIDNILAAWHWAVKQNNLELLASSCDALGLFFDRALRQSEGETLFQHSLSQLSAEQHGQLLHCHYLTIIARLQMTLQRLPEAIATARRSMEMAADLDSIELIARNRLCMAAALYTQGHYKQALEQIELGRPLCAAFPMLNALCNQYQASINFLQGNYQQAHQLQQSALRFYEEQPPDFPKQRSVLLNNIGNVALHLGYVEQARQHYEQSVELRLRGNRRNTTSVVALSNLGLVALAQQRFDNATAYLHEALQLHQQSGHQIGESRLLVYMSMHSYQIGAGDAALRYAEQSLAILDQLHRHGLRALRFTQLALAWLQLGDPKKALAYVQQALQSAENQGEKHYYAFSLTVMGDAQLAVGAYAAANDAYQQALTLRRKLQQKTLAIEPMAGLATVALAQGGADDAMVWIRPILDYLEQSNLDGTYKRYYIYQTCYRALLSIHDADAADAVQARAQSDMRHGSQSIHDPSICAAFQKTISESFTDP